MLHQSSQLALGRAGEHLAMFDLLTHGIKCFLTAQGINYDIVAEINGKIVKIQVKSTEKPTLLSKYKTPVYKFSVRRSGSDRIYGLDEFDVFALVCLDTKTVCYVSHDKVINREIILRDKRFNYEQTTTKTRPYTSELDICAYLNSLVV